MNLLKQIFSVRNEKKHKVITILGIKIKKHLNRLAKPVPVQPIIPQTPPRICPQSTRKKSSRKYIAVSGFCYSGSSTVCDMLSEFNDVTSLSHRKKYSGEVNQKNHINCEVTFFQHVNSIFGLVAAVESGDSIKKDYILKKFIDHFYLFNAENKDIPVYQNNFLKIHIDFLQKILDLDDYTKEYMKDKKYPTVLSWEEDKYENCSFIYNYPNHPYIFYKLKDMPLEEFDVYVSDYLHDFFDNIPGCNAVILDQLFSTKLLLDKMNFYMNDNPIKEICVYRDPRDEFINLWRDQGKYQTFDDKIFIRRYKVRCIKKLEEISPNRLCIRFEDMVLNYDETVEKILEFVDMDKSDHIYKKQIFIPEKSVVNIGEYKEFHEQSVIRNIEEALPEYLYERQG